LIVRKNISIDQCYVDKLKPFLEKNNGNLSAAIRDAIETASLTLAGKTGENGEKDSSKDSQHAELRNKLIEEEEFLLVHHTLLEWLIKRTSGLLIDESIIYELINPYKVKRIPDIVSYLNSLNEKMGWKIKVNVECNRDFEPEAANLTLSNGNSCFREIMAHSLALYMAKQMKLDVQGLFSKSNVTKVYFKRFQFLDYQKVPKGLEQHFGPMEGTYREVQKRPDFWKNLIKTYRQQNYQLLSMNRKIFEAFVSGNIPSVDDMARNFELVVGKPPAAFTLAEHIIIFKELYLTDGIGSDIEICTEKGSEYVKLIHDYSNQKVCEYITKYYSNIFKSIGYPFTITTNPHIIVFEFREGFSSTSTSESGIISIES
jgi:predicted RNA-binding protein Jag